jgi:hypothetical protein
MTVELAMSISIFDRKSAVFAGQSSINIATGNKHQFMMYFSDGIGMELR